MDAYPPDDSTPATRAWEKWAETVKVGDRCQAGGAPATVTAVTDDYLWARVDGQMDAHPWEWEQVDAPDLYTESKCGRSPYTMGATCSRCGATPGMTCPVPHAR